MNFVGHTRIVRKTIGYAGVFMLIRPHVNVRRYDNSAKSALPFDGHHHGAGEARYGKFGGDLVVAFF